MRLFYGAVLGCGFGIFITNSLWVTHSSDRVGNIAFASACAVAILLIGCLTDGE